MRIHAARASEDPSRSKLSKPDVNRLSSTAQQWRGTGEQKLPSTEGRDLESNQLLHLQRTIGNHRVGELLGRAYGIASPVMHVVPQADWKSVQAKPAIDQLGSPFEREADVLGDAATSSSRSRSRHRTGSTLPFREATELLECIRIMGEANRDYCRAEVLGEKPEIVEEAWARVKTTGPRLLDGQEPSYQVGFDHLLPPVPTGVKQMWQVVENTITLLTDQCELKTETDFRIDIVDIGSRTRINDSWGWIRRDKPCFAMEESKATVGFDDQASNLAQQTNVKASEQLAQDTLKKMTGPKGRYSGVYTFVKSTNCKDCPDKLKDIQEQNKARNGEALTIEGIGSFRS